MGCTCGDVARLETGCGPLIMLLTDLALYGLPFTLNVAERRELLGDLAQAASLSRQGTGPIEPLRLRDDFRLLFGM